MTRRVANNPSGKYLAMNEAQVDRAAAAFARAVERQRQRDLEAVKASERMMTRLRARCAAGTCGHKREQDHVR